MIALLRYSGIPARYAYGTVQAPIAQVMNWVGGVTAPEAALQLLGQGGIPSIGLTSGGVFKAVKLEHVWVEAYVDYVPSRGAVNKTPDTWVPLDASFKQYQFTQGLDLKTAVPFDAQALANQIKASAQVNETEGWVTGVNSSLIQTTLTNYQTQVQNYINTQKPHATVGEVLGTQTIIPENFPHLMGTLPYQTLVKANVFTTIPDNLRHKFQFNLYASSLDRALDSPTLTLNQSLPQLAGKKITLSFAPATQADVDLLNSFLPKPHLDGTPIQPSEIPTSLPGYLIHLTAEIRINGETVITGGNFILGQELASTMGLFEPNKTMELVDNRPIAGEYHAIGLDLQGIVNAQLIKAKDQLKANQTKIANQQLSSLTKEELTGDVLNTAMITYFAQADSFEAVSAYPSGVITYRLPSFGLFTALANPHFFFGIVRSVTFPGLGFDVDHLASIATAKDNNTITRINYVKQSGYNASALEHKVPEKLFTSSQNPIPGVSSISLLAEASRVGQRIYTITRTNSATAIPQLNLDTETKQDITNAVNTGKEVVVSQNNVTLGGYSGVGYIVTDPATGAAGYLISGGANGGFLKWFNDNIVPWLTIFAIGVSLIEGVAVLALLLAISLFLASFINFLQQSDAKCGNAGVALYLVPAILTAFAGFAGPGAAAIALSIETFIVDGAVNATC